MLGDSGVLVRVLGGAAGPGVSWWGGLGGVRGTGSSHGITPSRLLGPSPLQVPAGGCPHAPRPPGCAWWAAVPRGSTRLSTSSRYRGAGWGSGWCRAGVCPLSEASRRFEGSGEWFGGAPVPAPAGCGVAGGLLGTALALHSHLDPFHCRAGVGSDVPGLSGLEQGVDSVLRAKAE